MSASAVPAIAFDDLDLSLRETLRPRYERLGYLGEFFARTAHQPAALEAFVEFTEAARAALPDRLAEVVALTVACALGNDYERNQHERLAVRLGLGRDWVARVERLDPAAAGLTAEERCVQRWVLAALADAGRGAQPAVDALVRELGTDTAVAVLLLGARYIAHAHIVNSLGIDPPVPSIFVDGFDA